MSLCDNLKITKQRTYLLPQTARHLDELEQIFDFLFDTEALARFHLKQKKMEITYFIFVINSGFVYKS